MICVSSCDAVLSRRVIVVVQAPLMVVIYSSFFAKLISLHRRLCQVRSQLNGEWTNARSGGRET